MTKRKPRRKAPKKVGRPISWLWWAAGLLSLGWIVFDANRAVIQTAVPQLASLIEGQETRAASTQAPPKAPIQAQPPAVPRQISRAERLPAVDVTPPPARVAAIARVPAPAEIVPTQRPSTRGRGAAAGGIVTSRPTPLLREPSANAPVWVTLEAGRPVRVMAKEGEWRRVETGIFTGWINADFLEAQARRDLMPVRSASTKTRQPVPPSAIPGIQR